MSVRGKPSQTGQKSSQGLRILAAWKQQATASLPLPGDGRRASAQGWAQEAHQHSLAGCVQLQGSSLFHLGVDKLSSSQEVGEGTLYKSSVNCSVP